MFNRQRCIRRSCYSFDRDHRAEFDAAWDRDERWFYGTLVGDIVDGMAAAFMARETA